MQKETQAELQKPILLPQEYKYVIAYTYPGPLSCLSGVQAGCSEIVNGGVYLGLGKFCDYMVLCAGTTVTIFYNRFAPIA